MSLSIVIYSILHSLNVHTCITSYQMSTTTTRLQEYTGNSVLIPSIRLQVVRTKIHVATSKLRMMFQLKTRVNKLFVLRNDMSNAELTARPLQYN